MIRIARYILIFCLSSAVIQSVAQAEPVRPSYALFRLDALGIAPQLVDQLERILRVELERVLGHTVPSRAEVERVAATNPKLAGCTADPACLAPLARALKSNRIIAGNVGGLVDNYVVNLKLVDSDGHELRRVTATLRGSPEELIDEIRVATYRLVAPDRLVGSIAILSDVPGAEVTLDGRLLGRTPISDPVGGLSAGMHRLTVTREGFSSFEEDVPVRFEKATQVVVRQSATTEKARRSMRGLSHTPVYARWWLWTAVAAGAVGLGIGIGFALPKQGVVDCARESCR